MGSNPSRVIPLLGIAHPVKGILFQVQGAIRKATLIRGCVLEESRVVALVFVCRTCIKTLNFDICFG